MASRMLGAVWGGSPGTARLHVHSAQLIYCKIRYRFWWYFIKKCAEAVLFARAGARVVLVGNSFIATRDTRPMAAAT